MLAQICWKRFVIAEVSCPTRYFREASSINFRRSVLYGFGCLWTAVRFRLARWNVMSCRLFKEEFKQNAGHNKSMPQKSGRQEGGA